MPLIEIGDEYRVRPADLLQPSSVQHHSKIPKAFIMYSNCVTPSGRETYIQQFLQAFPKLASNQGRCWGGTSSDKAYTLAGVETKVKWMRRHMFTFCLENSYVQDYE